MNALIVFAIVCLAACANAGILLPAPATLVGSSGIVGPDGAVGPSGIVTRSGAVGPTGINNLGLGLGLGLARVGGLGLGLGLIRAEDDGQWHGEGLWESQDLAGAYGLW